MTARRESPEDFRASRRARTATKSPKYTVAKIADRCWGVTEDDRNYPGHLFPTRRSAVAFAEGRCEHCNRRLTKTRSSTGPVACRPDSQSRR
jgi:hypothetical protein